MEAVTIAGRARLARTWDAVAAGGLGSWLLGLLVFAGFFAAFNNGATSIPQESRLQVGIAATGLVCGVGFAAGALVAASNTRDAPRGVAFGIAAVSLLVALYALGGKVIPGLHFASFDLNPGDEFSRVREPIGYWNAVGIVCVMATPAFIWLAAFPDAAARVRIGSLLAL